MIHSCKRCLRVFSRKDYLVKHLHSKIICTVAKNGEDLSSEDILLSLQRPRYTHMYVTDAKKHSKHIPLNIAIKKTIVKCSKTNRTKRQV